MNKKNLVKMFEDAVRVSMPQQNLGQYLPKQPPQKVVVVAVGKAAAEMAKYAEAHYNNVEGIALTRYQHGSECKYVEVVEASHPVPDNKGREYTQKIITKAAELTKDDLLLFLVSGGGSALFTAPRGISFEQKQEINKALLMSGASIGEMNIVRKHLSDVKGGRFAQIAKNTRVVTLAISDVPNDEPTTIASGPTVPDPSTCQDAIDILLRYDVGVNDELMKFLGDPKNETPKPNDPIFDNATFEIIANANMMLEHIASKAEGEVVNLGADVEGEAKIVAKNHAQIAKDNKGKLIISGGETTVTVDSNEGKGGRNCEYLLALAIETEGQNIHALAADTDGIDGSETNAGAVITPDTIKRAKKMGMNPQQFLEEHNSYTFFEKLGDLVVTGPTKTNVNDLRVIQID